MVCACKCFLKRTPEGLGLGRLVGWGWIRCVWILFSGSDWSKDRQSALTGEGLGVFRGFSGGLERDDRYRTVSKPRTAKQQQHGATTATTCYSFDQLIYKRLSKDEMYQLNYCPYHSNYLRIFV
jgi:hypothetical protein